MIELVSYIILAVLMGIAYYMIGRASRKAWERATQERRL